MQTRPALVELFHSVWYREEHLSIEETQRVVEDETRSRRSRTTRDDNYGV